MSQAFIQLSFHLAIAQPIAIVEAHFHVQVLPPALSRTQRVKAQFHISPTNTLHLGDAESNSSPVCLKRPLVMSIAPKIPPLMGMAAAAILPPLLAPGPA